MIVDASKNRKRKQEKDEVQAQISIEMGKQITFFRFPASFVKGRNKRGGAQWVDGAA